MNKQSQKRIIEINHALSGIYGDNIKSTAFKINQARKQILKKLDRKKKLSSIIYDELYGYLQKFPEEKSGLNQQFVKKKKARLSEFQERYLYKSPSFTKDQTNYLTKGTKKQLEDLSSYFQYHIQIEAQSSQSKQ